MYMIVWSILLCIQQKTEDEKSKAASRYKNDHRNELQFFKDFEHSDNYVTRHCSVRHLGSEHFYPVIVTKAHKDHADGIRS